MARLFILGAERDGLLQHLKLAHDADQANGGFGGPGVRRLELALLNGGGRGRRGLQSGIGDKVIAALFGQSGGAGEVGDVEAGRSAFRPGSQCRRWRPECCGAESSVSGVPWRLRTA